MNARRVLSTLLATGLALVGSVALATPSQASGSCGAGTSLTGAAVGSVTTFDNTDWYRATALQPTGTWQVTLTPLDGDVDLAVYNDSCTQVCASSVGSIEPDVCTVSLAGPINISVRYYSALNAPTVDYAIEAVQVSADTSTSCPVVAGQTICASLTPTTVQGSYTVYAPGSTPTSVVGYVDSYRFTLPNGGVVTLPCVSLFSGSTTVAPCDEAGGTFVSHVETLSTGTVQVPNASLTSPVTTVKVCNANLEVTVDGFGVNQFPAYTVC
jgi:hypothetical protein